MCVCVCVCVFIIGLKNSVNSCPEQVVGLLRHIDKQCSRVLRDAHAAQQECNLYPLPYSRLSISSSGNAHSALQVTVVTVIPLTVRCFI
jgi:hypothetical protein